jgi:hypothetical protein
MTEHTYTLPADTTPTTFRDEMSSLIEMNPELEIPLTFWVEKFEQLERDCEKQKRHLDGWIEREFKRIADTDGVRVD